MAYRPAQIYTGSGWDDIGDPRVGTVQTDVTNLQNGKLAYETPLTDQSGTTYTFALADARRITRATNAAAKTFTIPPQTSVTWANNSIIRVVNSGAGALTVNGGSGVTVTNTAKTIGQFESAAAIRTGSNAWTLVPFGSGDVPAADFSNTATGTYTDGGINYKYITFTASGTLTVTKAGIADILVIGGGGGGSPGSGGGRTGGAGGAGGYVPFTSSYLTDTAHTVTVGGGGALQTRGGDSRLGTVQAIGGGGAISAAAGALGGSGSGGSAPTFSPGSVGGGSGISPQGNAGGSGSLAGGSGGGGGANGAGADGSSGGAGGAGIASSITGTSVTRSVGGSKSTNANGSANTGDGGGGSSGDSGGGGTGGSGVVIIRVKV